MSQLMKSESWLAEIRNVKPLRVWGIDLGTTNSTLAEIRVKTIEEVVERVFGIKVASSNRKI